MPYYAINRWLKNSAKFKKCLHIVQKTGLVLSTEKIKISHWKYFVGYWILKQLIYLPNPINMLWEKQFMFFSIFWVSFRCYITKNDKNIKVNAAEGWICIWFSSLAFKVCQSKKSMKVFQLMIMWYFETQVSDYFRLLWWLNAQKSTLHESTVKPQWLRQKS